MGCGTSKIAGVAPEQKLNRDHDDKMFTGARLKDEPNIPAQTTAAGTTAVQSISLESCAATPREFSTTQHVQQQSQQQPTAKQQQKQPDPEFDYDLPPNPAAAIKPAASGALQPLGSTAFASSSTAVQSSATVGGLLSRQPDWLQNDSSDGGARQAAGNVTLFSNSESGAADSTSGSIRAVSSLPPIGRGLAAYKAAGNSSRGRDSFLPLVANGLVQQSITAPAGIGGAAAALAMELPAPRRLTANISSNMIPGLQATRVNRPDSSDGHGGFAEAAATAAAAAEDTGGVHQASATLQRQSSSTGGNLQGSNSFSNSSSSCCATSVDPSTAGSTADPPNPWSALQNHVGAAGPPSPDTTIAGGTADAAAAAAAPAAGRRKSGVGAQAAVLGAGVGAGSKHPAREADELVLEDSSDLEMEESSSITQDKAGHGASVDEQVAAVTAAVLAEQHKVSSGVARLQGEGSVSRSYRSMHDSQQQQQQQYGGGLAAERSTVRAGGWGTGSMAAAGTLMLGADDTLVLSEAGGTNSASTAAGALAQDDVFGGESPRHSVGVLSSSTSVRQGAPGVVRETSSSSSVGHRATAASAAVMQQHEEILGVEEIDDVDELIEAELAAKNALPGDLAAKLAAFEAMADADE